MWLLFLINPRWRFVGFLAVLKMYASHIGARMKAWEDSKPIKEVQGFGFKVSQP